jgi:hypothetical protein
MTDAWLVGLGQIGPALAWGASLMRAAVLHEVGAPFEPRRLTLGERVIRGSCALRIDPLVRRVGLDGINGALDAIRSGEAVRSVIVYP